MMKGRTGVKYKRKKEKEGPSKKLENKMALENERFELSLLREHLKSRIAPEAFKELKGLMAKNLKALKDCRRSLEGMQEKHGKAINEFDRLYARSLASPSVPLAEKKALNKEYLGHMINVFNYYQSYYLMGIFMRNQLMGVKGERKLKESLDTDSKEMREHWTQIEGVLLRLKQDRQMLEGK